MSDKWSGAGFTAADVADIIAATSSFMGVGATVTGNFKMTAGKLAQWFRQVGFAAAIAAAVSPGAVNWVFQNGSGADNAPGNFTITAPLATGNALGASLILQVGVQVAGSSSVTQTPGNAVVFSHTAAAGHLAALGGGATFTTALTSTTALATPSAFAATQGSLFASTVSGATVMGFGTTHDVAFKNRGGTSAAGVVANTTTFAMVGAATVGSTLAVTGLVTGSVTNAIGFDANSAGVSKAGYRWSTNSATRWDVVVPSGSSAMSWQAGGSSEVMSLTSAGVLSTASTLGVNTAAITNRAIQVSGSVVGASGLAFGMHMGATLVASANGDALYGINIGTGTTPGSFTGLIRRGLVVGSATTSGYTSPADPVQLQIADLTGTGATNALAIMIEPPGGATNNFLLATTNLTTFAIRANGTITWSGTALSASAGSVSFGGVTRTTIGANGGATALTALPLGYLDVYVAGTAAQMPYYNRGA